MRTIFHIDFNSYFATVEQQANPRLRGKPIAITGGPDHQASQLAGVAGGDRKTRTVINAASIEAKKKGVKTPMQIWEAKRICPELILVTGDSDKYLSVTKKFLNILKDYSPDLEIFSIDECFLEINSKHEFLNSKQIQMTKIQKFETFDNSNLDIVSDFFTYGSEIALDIKNRIKKDIGEWMQVSVGISYNKLMAKLASNLQKPDGLVIIPNEQEAIKILDKLPLDAICGIGSRIMKRLNKMGIFTFKQLRELPLGLLTLEFKSYGNFLYDAARGIHHLPIMPFYEKPEVKSIGHRLTISQDTDNELAIKQILLKLTELIARKLRSKKLVGKTVSCWFRYALDYKDGFQSSTVEFSGDGMQMTIPYTNNGLDIFNAAWKNFQQLWDPSTSSGQGAKIRMIGASISNLQSETPQNLTFLANTLKQEKIIKALDTINDKFGEFTLQRGVLINTGMIRRQTNSFLADRRFKV